MVLNARSVGILIRLIRSHSFVPAEELGREMGISRATVANDVKTINQWLQKHDLDTIRYHRSAGYYFEAAARTSVKEKLGELNLDRQYKNTREERIAWMGVLLLTRENSIFIKTLIGRFLLSRSTIQRDLKLLSATLMHFRLTLKFNKKHGYFIYGDEHDKRKVLVYFLSKIHPHREASWLHSNPHSADEWRRDLVASPHAFKIYQILLDSDKYLNVCLSDDGIELLSIQLLLLLSRYKQGKIVHLDPVEKVMVKPSSEFQASSFIGKKITASFGVEIPDDELCYITVCLMEAKTHHRPANSSDEDMEILKSVIIEMVDQFQKEAAVKFKDRDALERSLFFHIKSAYYRIIHGIEFENPLAETIINNYSNLFLLTKKVIPHLEDVIGESISNDELALITMHFGGWVEKGSISANQI